MFLCFFTPSFQGMEAGKDVDDVGVPLKRKSSDGAEAKEGI